MKCAFIDLGKHFGGAENYLLVLIERWVAAGNEAVVCNDKFLSVPAILVAVVRRVK